jgi:glyoxylase-like metal-dependent hydrolase (beta-lactamase superfamily II)
VGREKIEAYQSVKGASIYRIPLDLFPNLKGYAHVVISDDLIVLVDVGSGFGDSNQQLERGLLDIYERYGEPTLWEDITHILITHAHLDHFGGLSFVQSRCSAPVGVHELDRRVLINYEERVVVVAKRLRDFLVEAGVSQDRRSKLMDLYLINKHLFRSVPVDFTYDEIGMRLGRIDMMHVSGHCPGHVVFNVDDILLCGDHILKGTSPHQAPERLSLNTGLGHYLESLVKVLRWRDEIHLTLGGHEGPIDDVKERIREILLLHEERLALVLSLLEEPRTIAEVSEELFTDVEGYHSLLAIEEAGAHVEYLEQRGYLIIDNIEALQSEEPIAIRYRQTLGSTPPNILSAYLGERERPHQVYERS